MEALSRDLETHAFGNPHSVNPPSLLTDARVDSARRRLLELFGADETTHDLVLTRSGTGALNLLGDAFPWTPESTYAFTRANHNSVLGIRSVAGQYGAQYGALSEEGVEAWLADPEMRHPPFLPGGSEHAGPRRARAAAAESAHRPTYSLFAYPARDNYDGVMYPLKWVQAVQAKSTPGHKWKVRLFWREPIGSKVVDRGRGLTRFGRAGAWTGCAGRTRISREPLVSWGVSSGMSEWVPTPQPQPQSRCHGSDRGMAARPSPRPTHPIPTSFHPPKPPSQTHL